MASRLAQVFQVPTDLDYVAGFQDLARVNLEIRRQGPTVERLLRKATLERAIGNHWAGLQAIVEAQRMAPDHPEVQYGLGVTYFFLAMAEAGALPVGPKPPGGTSQGVRELLTLALDAFAVLVQRNPEDAEAARDLSVISELLAAQSDDLTLAEALRAR